MPTNTESHRWASAAANSDEPGEKVLHCTEVWGGNWRVDRSVTLPGLDAWVFSEPCEHAAAGGDVHYVSACAAGQVVRVLVADVSGHGPAVAEMADTLRRMMRRLVNTHDQRRLVRHLNREFARAVASATNADGRPAEYRFATAVAVTFDSQSRRVLICNAGHPPPLWYRADQRRWTTLEPTNPQEGNVPVGVISGFLFEQFERHVGIGDLILCYTDSLIEARDAAGNQIGGAGLLDRVRSIDPTGNVETLVPSILASLGELDPENLTRDDLTCLLLRVNGTRPLIPLLDRLLSPARAAAGLAGIHLPAMPRR